MYPFYRFQFRRTVTALHLLNHGSALRTGNKVVIALLLGILSGMFFALPTTFSQSDPGLTLYWTQRDNILPGEIKYADEDGTNIQGIALQQADPVGIAFDPAARKIYWADVNSDKIQRADLDGSNREDLVTSGLTSPNGIALDSTAGKMYWTDVSAGTIQPANLGGSTIEDLVTVGLAAPRGIAVDSASGKIYWTDSGTDKIQRANLDGSNVEDLITSGLSFPRGLALELTTGKIYWADSGTDKIQRANLDGSNVEDLVTTAGDSPRGIALDHSVGKVYWTDPDVQMIRRANLDGSNIEDLITTGVTAPDYIALVSSAYDCTASSILIPQTECQFLVDLYESTSGSEWTTQTNWLESNTPCDWYGVTCEADRVVELKLESNGLNGSLPSGISNLTALRALDLYTNQLTDSLPEEVGLLTNLQELTLSSNQFTGTIPAEIGTLQSLVALSLSRNQFSDTIPKEMGNLANLEDLFLDGNQLSGSIPGEMGNLKKLGRLQLNNNQLTGTIPISLTTLSELGYLRLGANQLSGALPPELGNLSSLYVLGLYSNLFTGTIPVEITGLPLLQILDLPANALSGPIPPEMISMDRLNTLNLGFNQLWSDESALTIFLNQLDPDWSETQTVAPTNLQVTAQNGTSIQLGWTPISYTLNGGHYEISYAPQASGIYTIHGTTSDKTDNSYMVDGLTPNTSYLFRIRSYTPVHLGPNEAVWAPDDDQKNELFSVYSPSIAASTGGSDSNTTTPTPVTPTPSTPTAEPTATPTGTTPTPTSTPSVDGDAYEQDDTCAQAKGILADGLAQTHSFHRSGDADWLRLETEANASYQIEVVIPNGSPADVNLELYPDCDSLPSRIWNERFTPGARLQLDNTTEGAVYIRASNADNSQGGAHIIYDIHATQNTDTSQGALILLAGRLSGGDRLQRNIHNVTEQVYELFQSKGLSNEKIYYLATDGTLPGYDAPASLNNLRLAITEWAPDQVDGGSLTLYLIDHGARDLFYVDEDEHLTPTLLDEWLTTFESEVPDAQVNVIVEACHAGSFVEAPGSLSKAGRVIITSTNVDNDAYASRFGAHFSDHFLVALNRNINLYSSFWGAKETVNRLYSLQQPWLDANGNGFPNEAEDASIASQRGFGYPGSFPDVWPPYIVTAKLAQPIEDGRGILEAEVRDNSGIDSVWAVIYPPSYSPPESGNELVPEDLETILLQSHDDDQYRGTYSGFTEQGVYRIVIHANDEDNLQAQPKALSLNTQQEFYLPLLIQ
ncbi:MAG: fibronectin type III domain-containing protein [Chloroflexota bacterium]